VNVFAPPADHLVEALQHYCSAPAVEQAALALAIAQERLAFQSEDGVYQRANGAIDATHVWLTWRAISHSLERLLSLGLLRSPSGEHFLGLPSFSDFMRLSSAGLSLSNLENCPCVCVS
jgi:hypothetical protein